MDDENKLDQNIDFITLSVKLIPMISEQGADGVQGPAAARPAAKPLCAIMAFSAKEGGNEFTPNDIIGSVDRNLSHETLRLYNGSKTRTIVALDQIFLACAKVSDEVGCDGVVFVPGGVPLK